MTDRGRIFRVLRGGSGRMVISNLGAQGLNFVGGLILARQLGTTGRGQVALVTVYDEVSTGVCSLGIPIAAGFHAKSGSERQDVLLGAALRASLITLPVTALVSVVVAALVFPASPMLQAAVITSIAGTPLANTFLVTARMLLIAAGRLRELAWILPAQMAVRLGAFGLLLSFGQFTAGAAALVIVLSGWAGNLLGWKLLGIRPRAGGRMLPLVRYGLRTVPGSLANLANSRLDQMIVAPVLGVRQLGIYAVAVGVTFVPMNVGNALSASVFSRVHSIHDPALFRTVSTSFAAIAASGVLTAIGIVAFLEPLYGEAFSAATTPALVLVPGTVAAGCFAVLMQLGNATGLPWVASASQIVGLAATIVGLALFLPGFGVTGAAAVSSASYLLRLAVATWRIRRARRSPGADSIGLVTIQGASPAATDDDR